MRKNEYSKMYLFVMESVDYTEFRKNLASYLDEVENDRVSMIITRSHGQRE